MPEPEPLNVKNVVDDSKPVDKQVRKNIIFVVLIDFISFFFLLLFLKIVRKWANYDRALVNIYLFILNNIQISIFKLLIFEKQILMIAS